MDRPRKEDVKGYSLTFFSLLCAVSGSAQAEPAAWRVTGEDTGELLLLGSVHYLRQEDYPLPSNIDELYQQADALVMELDLDDLDALSVQSLFVEAGMLPPGSSLQTVLTPAVYELAETRSAEFGLDLAFAASFEPWLVAITLMDLGMNALGFNASRGLEQHLLRRATSDGKQILGLETLEDQIHVFDQLSIKEQEALLLQTLNEIDSADDAMDELLNAWRDGRVNALANELTANFEDFPILYRHLVIDRNERWLDTLRQLLETGGRYLVVVGALHLVGDDSVIELLQHQGLSVVEIN